MMLFQRSSSTVLYRLVGLLGVENPSGRLCSLTANMLLN